MAILTPAQLQSSNASTYTTNGTNSITGANARNFNVDWISSSVLLNANNNISGSQVISGSVNGNVQAIAVSSNTASINLATGNFFTVTLANSATTFFNVTNVTPGLTTNLVLTTGTVSSASFSSNVKQTSGSAYLPTSGSGQIDVLSLVAVDASNVYLVASKKFV
jgi:hypothetical protein